MIRLQIVLVDADDSDPRGHHIALLGKLMRTSAIKSILTSIYETLIDLESRRVWLRVDSAARAIADDPAVRRQSADWNHRLDCCNSVVLDYFRGVFFPKI